MVLRRLTCRCVQLKIELHMLCATPRLLLDVGSRASSLSAHCCGKKTSMGRTRKSAAEKQAQVAVEKDMAEKKLQEDLGPKTLLFGLLDLYIVPIYPFRV